MFFLFAFGKILVTIFAFGEFRKVEDGPTTEKVF
jgi:hypothetical protein